MKKQTNVQTVNSTVVDIELVSCPLAVMILFVAVHVSRCVALLP